jgi:hypothetical protein
MSHFFEDFIFASFWGKKSPKTEYHVWAQDLEKKIRNILGSISLFPTSTDALNGEQTKKINTQLTELENALQFENSQLESNETAVLNPVRNLLLKLWAQLIKFLEQKIKDVYDASPYLNIIFRTMIRYEFDPYHLKFINWSTPQSSQEYGLFRLYCGLMSDTHRYVTRKLSDCKPKSSQIVGPRSIALYAAIARILVLNYFQIPHVQDEILKAVSLDSEVDLWNFTQTPSQLKHQNNDSNIKNITSNSDFTTNLQHNQLETEQQRQQSRSFAEMSALQNIANIEKADQLNLTNTIEIDITEKANKLITNKPKSTVVPMPTIQLDETVFSEDKEFFVQGTLSRKEHVLFLKNLQQQKQQDIQCHQRTQRQVNDLHARNRPNLFQKYFGWEKMHTLIASLHNLNISTATDLSVNVSQTEPSPWTLWFSRGDPVFFAIFLREWIYFVNSKIVIEYKQRQLNPSYLKSTPPIISPVSKRTMPSSLSSTDNSVMTSKGSRTTSQKAEIATEVFCLGTVFDWNALKGFNELVKAFLYQLKRSEFWNKPLTDCSMTLLKCDPSLLNFFIKDLYNKTNIYDFATVSDTLTKIGDLLTALQKAELTVPLSFDMDYFCSGLDIIIDTDHHQLIAKLLSVVYNHADVFVGYNRKKLFGDFFIGRYFFKFFLHWDEIVRNYFHQIVIFRMVRVKRSELHKIGIDIPELGPPSKTVLQQDLQSFLERQPPDLWVDIELYITICAYIKAVEGQCRSHAILRFDPQLEVYVPQAMYEYHYFLSRYYKWEAQNSDQVPSLITMSMLRNRPPVVADTF